MKRLNKGISFLLSLTLLYGCNDQMEFPLEERQGLSPVYFGISSFVSQVAWEPVRPVEWPSKLVVNDTRAYLIDELKGIHVIDISSGTDMAVLGFLEVVGIRDISIYNGFLYVAAFDVLMKFDIQKGIEPVLVDYVGNAFPNNLPMPGELAMSASGSYYPLLDVVPRDSFVIIGWQEVTIRTDMEIAELGNVDFITTDGLTYEYIGDLDYGHFVPRDNHDLLEAFNSNIYAITSADEVKVFQNTLLDAVATIDIPDVYRFVRSEKELVIASKQRYYEVTGIQTTAVIAQQDKEEPSKQGINWLSNEYLIFAQQSENQSARYFSNAPSAEFRVFDRVMNNWEVFKNKQVVAMESLADLLFTVDGNGHFEVFDLNNRFEVETQFTTSWEINELVANNSSIFGFGNSEFIRVEWLNNEPVISKIDL